MARLMRAAPVLLVRDVVAAAEYWRDRLGFELPGYFGDPPAFTVMRRDDVEVMLASAPVEHRPSPNRTVVDRLWNAYFDVDDADALHAELRARGARIDYAPRDQPWGMREFGIRDLDGHEIGFGAPTRPAD
jgi:uncharacterized glyoxalase superfamily protein PhnB